MGNGDGTGSGGRGFDTRDVVRGEFATTHGSPPILAGGNLRSSACARDGWGSGRSDVLHDVLRDILHIERPKFGAK